jgi:hypothetical protein
MALLAQIENALGVAPDSGLIYDAFTQMLDAIDTQMGDSGNPAERADRLEA